MNEDISNVPQMPWPQLGDIVFRSDDDWWMNACLDHSRADWDTYATAYKDAADVLVNHTVTARHQLDLLVYPIAFLYRQYLELRLKELIVAGTKLLGTELPSDWKNHRIDRLWAHCREILQQVWPDGPKCDLEAVGECIRQFASVDSLSMAFRYPEDKVGKPSLTQLPIVNVRNLAEVIARTAGLLDSSSSVMSEYLDQQRDMESSCYL